MDNTVISNWNKRIKANDEVYILDEVTIKGAGYATEALRQLKGRKYLIKGNRDRFSDQRPYVKKEVVQWYGYMLFI